VEKSDVEAARWCRKVANKGHAQAQFNLRNMHVKGVGAKKSDGEAARWWRKAANQGDAISQLNIGIAFFRKEKD
jgi:hypothetical protein